jgi:transcriptional regulator with GAF, ATPase, and Fis domain
MNEVSQAESSREQLVTRAFVSLADTLVDDYDTIELLTRLVGYSVTLFRADAGGILLADAHEQLRVVATSNEDAQLVELMQLQNNEGPCLDCYHTVTTVTVPDLRQAAARWPAFVAAANERSAFRAVHAIPLRLRQQTLGALNLWHRQPHTPPANDLAVGQALADVATIAILQERVVRRAEILNEQLHTALTSRLVIEQAKGVLAQYAQVPMDQAFESMRRHARSHNRRLAEVARDIAQRTLDPGTVLPADPDLS